MLVATEERSQRTGGRDRKELAARGVGIVLMALPLVAIAAGAWLWWTGRDAPLLEGRFDAIAAAEPVDAARQPPAQHHALLRQGQRVTWMEVADGGELGRNGTNMAEDVGVMLGAEGTAKRPVEATMLQSGAIAWASPRRARLVDAQERRVVASVDTCDEGVTSLVHVGERLLVAGCGRVVGVGPGGEARWRAEIDAGGFRRVELHRLGTDAVLVAPIGGDAVVALDAADGEELWRHSVDGSLSAVTRIGDGMLAAASSSGDAARMVGLESSSGAERWSRSWRGWQVAALAGDRNRVVAGLVGANDSDQCTRSGLVELAGGTGATTGTRTLDRELAVRDLRHDANTSRMAALVAGRPCSIVRVEPRVDVLPAKGLQQLHQAVLPGQPCSNLGVDARLAAVATCDGQVVVVDTLRGTMPWRATLPEVATRRSMAVTVTDRRVLVTDGVGSLVVLQPPDARPAAAEANAGATPAGIAKGDGGGPAKGGRKAKAGA